MANKYLYLNKQGTVFEVTESSWKTALNSYIKNTVKYESGFKLSESLWKSINDGMAGSGAPNQDRTNFFNSLCIDKALNIVSSIYNYKNLYPTPEDGPAGDAATDAENFFIITSGGKGYKYNVTTLSDALKAYIAENLVYANTFEVDEDLWNAVDASITTNIYKVDTFNALCKQAKHKIQRIVINAGDVYVQ